MEFLAFIIWIVLALTIPLVLIIISYFRYAAQVEASKIIFRFFAALVAYVPVTAITLIYFGGLINAVVHKKILGIRDVVFCFAVVLAYGFIGYLLSSFVSESFIKSLSVFSRDDEKPQPIFNKND